MKIIISIITVLSIISCSTEYELVGEWKEVKYQKEHLVIKETGEMYFNEVHPELSLKYEIVESNDDVIKFNVTISKNGKSKTALHQATFKSNDTITVENLDFPDVKENTYYRIKN